MEPRDHENGWSPTSASRLRALRSQVDRLERRLSRLNDASSRVSWIRLGIFVAGLLAIGLAVSTVGIWLAALCALVTTALFGVAVHVHNQIDRASARHLIWRTMKAGEIARARLDWEQIPAAATQPPDAAQQPSPDHPFAADLDLTGPRSLHRLLDRAISSEGSDLLRTWLLASVPDLAEIHRRQRLVRELVPLRRFRNRLALSSTLGAGRDRGWRAGDLERWLSSSPAEASLGRWVALLGALAALDAALFAANQVGLLPPLWQITFLIYAGLTLIKVNTVGSVWNDAMRLQGVLWQLRTVFRQLEKFSYSGAPNLAALCKPFRDSAACPSRHLARASRVLAALGTRGNPLVDFAVNAIAPWDLFFAYRLSRHKRSLAQRIPVWMGVWFELEALGSLAAAADLVPEDIFPDVVSADRADSSTVLRAEGLGHPLISRERRICNDFAVSRLGQVAIISGSNMSGKSAFLRTIAINLVIAYAGGAVPAGRFQTIPFRVFTCMNIRDSVTDGYSFFCAEVRRLRELLTELDRDGSVPLLYCIDEMFRGTNNRERLIGGRAYLQALAGGRGVGLVATHDLGLTSLAAEMPEIANYHFRDGVDGDRMVFDYTLRNGSCPTTNALKIMRLHGLPVPPMDDDSSTER